MVDTITQYQQVQAEIDQAVIDVIRSGQYINGPVVRGFAENLANYLDIPYIIPCANGTDALQIALMALGLKPGDEVITPSFTYIATVEVIALLRLKPVFVDVDPHTFNVNPKAVLDAITEKTKAIIPVHLFGQAADLECILPEVRKRGIYIVEDTAQAIGASYHMADGTRLKAGTIGDVGTTSFYPSKNLGAFGDGGAIFTRDAALAERLQMICNHGSKQRYYHDSIGVNSRLDAIQAAILGVKLKYLNRYTESRIEAARRYDELFSELNGITLPNWHDDGSHVFHQYTIKIHSGSKARDEIRTFLQERGIPSMIYYPVPCHLQPAYQEYGYSKGDLPQSEELCEQVISLPMHSELTPEQQSFIADNFSEAVQISLSIT